MRLLRLVLVFATAGALGVACGSNAVAGQELDPSQLLHPSKDTWPQYHGDYTGQRHSKLSQITASNVKNLTLAWAFQTNQEAWIKSSPLLVDGILYFTVPDNVWAVDARSGHQIWHYHHPVGEGEHIGHRGVAMYKGWLYFTTPDAHLLSLNAKDGSLRWDKVIADVHKGYWSTMAPLVVKDHVITGVGGDLDNIPGLLRSFDPETGEVQWEWLATPPADQSKVGTGGMTWVTGTYDPALNLLYWGTGNPTPVLNGTVRPGDNEWTCSIVALNPDTGKLVWGFSASPHDTHDWDAVETPVLVDANFQGQPRKMLMQSSRNGYFFVLDRANGKSLLTTPYGPVNWATGIDKDGRPIPNPDKEPKRDGRMIAPDEGGLTNYRSPSFDPKTGLFIVDSRFSYSVYFAKPEDGAYGWAGADYDVWGHSYIQAIDYETGKIRWRHDVGGGSGAGVLTTDTGLTFTGDSTGNILALSTADGKTLWHAQTGAPMQTSPMTYELDGRQYVVSGSGGVMFAWSLPEASGGK